MKIRIIHILTWTLALALVVSCTSTRNTSFMREYHALNTRYNVYFNGNESFREGMKKINESNKDDYSSIIPMYPISHHDNAKAAKSAMDRTIEKCRKAIKMHSIKTKPEFDYKKAKDPKYKKWFDQEEFNPALKDAWMLLGQAEFYQADFLGAVGTFSYISKHYSQNEHVVTACQLWIVRCYQEMDWIYEAEDLIYKIDVKNLSGDNIKLYSNTMADLMLVKKQYVEAIPFLEKSISKEKDKPLQVRFNFLLAQLYQKTGKAKEAYDAYSQVIQKNPPYELEFNARINRAELYQSSVKSIRKEIQKMIKSPNNADYLDQLYQTIAKTYLHEKDTAQAIVNLRLSVEESTRGGMEKARSLVLLGDLFYQQKRYPKAQPAYDEASKILTVGQDDYERVSKRVEILSDLVVQYEACVLQDSLQKLSMLSEAERLEVVKGVIKRMEEEEKRLAELEAAKQEKESQSANKGLNPFEVGNNRNSGWYFYNPNLVNKGRTDFLNKWGKRKLEDNWRRIHKSSALFAENETMRAVNDSLVNDSVQLASGDSLRSTAVSTDKKDPAFYLQQIPTTPEQLEASNDIWSDALFALAVVYKDKVEDYILSINTFNEFIERFSDNALVPDAIFQNYLLYSKLNMTLQAEQYRSRLLKDFPETKFALLLQQPDYINRSRRMFIQQDSIYDHTYKAYYANAFQTVKDEAEKVRKDFPMSNLMPKFMFLKALAIGKTSPQADFEEALKELTDQYPESDVSAMAKDIIALMLQGKESRQGSAGTLLARREEAFGGGEKDSSFVFSSSKEDKHRLMLLSPTSSGKINQLLYQIAVFNFSRFMVKDFDLFIDKIDTSLQVLSITNLQNYEEAGNYKRVIMQDHSLSELIQGMNARPVVISEINFDLLRSKLGLQEYFTFMRDSLGENIPKNDGNLLKMIDKISLDISEARNLPDMPMGKGIQAGQTPRPSTQKEVFKGLFTYDESESHIIVIYIQSGRIEMDKLKEAVDKFNTRNYPMLNMKAGIEKQGRNQMLVVKPLNNALIAKSYLQRMTHDESILSLMKTVNYRSLIGSEANIQKMFDKNELRTYLEFLRLYYLK